MILTLWNYASIAFFVTLLMTPVAIFYSRKKNLLDHPGKRRSHQSVIPRGGGVVAVSVLILLSLNLLISTAAPPPTAAWTSILAFISAVSLLGLIGYFDDHNAISSSSKLVVQILACGFSLYLLQSISLAPLADNIWLLMAAFMAMVWLTNLYNFMDGSHGLAAGQAIFSGLLYAAIFHYNSVMPLTVLASCMAAVSAGFFFWNFPRPRVFMGDVLSGALGVGFSVLIIAGWLVYQQDLILLCLVLASFVVDASLTLLWRILKGQKWYNPHREHAYQRLVAGRFGHVGTWMIYQSLNVLIVLPAVFLVMTGKLNSLWTTIFVYLLFSLLWYAVYQNYKDKNNKI